MTQGQTKLIGIIAIVILATGGTAAVIALSKKSDDTTSTSSQSMAASHQAASNTDTSAMHGMYKDGAYTAVGTYTNPGGTEKVSLTVTIKDGVITETSLDTSDATGDAAEYQSRFAGGYKSLVVGKEIDSVSLSRVSGSSLTSNGFNDALDAIKEQAKA